jgi:hypothetical protein
MLQCGTTVASAQATLGSKWGSTAYSIGFEILADNPVDLGDQCRQNQVAGCIRKFITEPPPCIYCCGSAKAGQSHRKHHSSALLLLQRQIPFDSSLLKPYCCYDRH